MYQLFFGLAEYVNYVLAEFYAISGNYGLSIIMLTALVNIITFPLTKKQLQSSKKMQEIQPELKKLQEKYKNDKEKLNRVTMEFMREKQVNPLGGCLPLLIQFPIIIAVFTLLREPWRFMDLDVINTNFLFLDLTTSPSQAATDIFLLNPYLVLPVMAAAATFFHQKLLLTDPRQKVMTYIFPVMILVISYNFPTGLVLYWFTNSILSVGNHFIIKTVEKSKEDKQTKESVPEPEKEQPKAENLQYATVHNQPQDINDPVQEEVNTSAPSKTSTEKTKPRKKKKKKKKKK